MSILKHIVKLYLIKKYYKKYVEKNNVILKDIEANILFRSATKSIFSNQKKFKHLMIYYTDFAYLFFWRINKHRCINRLLFYNDHTSIFKVFRNINLKGGVVPCHPFATIINAKEIGMNFKFRNNTTIGNINNDNNLRPVIGDNVELGANVVIIGEITVGDNVTVGAGAVVVKDIPSNSIAVGNPARIIKRI